MTIDNSRRPSFLLLPKEDSDSVALYLVGIYTTQSTPKNCLSRIGKMAIGICLQKSTYRHTAVSLGRIMSPSFSFHTWTRKQRSLYRCAPEGPSERQCLWLIREVGNASLVSNMRYDCIYAALLDDFSRMRSVFSISRLFTYSRLRTSHCFADSGYFA